MSVYTSLVAWVAVAAGLFASGDWRRVRGEAARYPGGVAAYAGDLVWTAVAWQVFTVGCVGLVFEVSALFSNVISVMGTPLAPVLAVAFLRERMTGLKAVAMWVLAPYMYQHYVDYQLLRKAEKAKEGVDHGLA